MQTGPLNDELVNKVIDIYAGELAERILGARLRVEEVARIFKVHPNTVLSWIEKDWLTADRGADGTSRPLIGFDELSNFVEWHGKEKSNG
jgi:hypothetical protein